MTASPHFGQPMVVAAFRRAMLNSPMQVGQRNLIGIGPPSNGDPGITFTQFGG
jgi:hypothetical protein